MKRSAPPTTVDGIRAERHQKAADTLLKLNKISIERYEQLVKDPTLATMDPNAAGEEILAYAVEAYSFLQQLSLFKEVQGRTYWTEKREELV